MLGQVRKADATDTFRQCRRLDERIVLLGGFVDLVKAPEVFHFARTQIESGRKVVIANHNLHSLYLLRRDPAFREFYAKAELIEVDSIPLILWARLVGRRSRRFHRCTYLDWRDQFWQWVARDDLRVFFVGGRPGVGETAVERLRGRWPAIEVGVRHGYFDVESGSPENEEVLDAVRRFRPHILLVGMGMPRQEKWILANLHRLPTCAIFTVGGAFDYEAGAQTPCPRWLGQLGAEWLFRLATNPRLFARYTVEPWSLVLPALWDVWGAAKRQLLRRPARSPTDLRRSNRPLMRLAKYGRFRS
jgi:N-acetylglucosaminyldiphosphoundecaprenol N-acetyl-beta-D-mannosaminyltransferase